MRVGFTAAAQRQLRNALNRIAADRPAAALGLLERVDSGLRRLERFPDSGRLVPEFPDTPYREIIVRPYRIFYRCDGEDLIVVAVWHWAQLPGIPSDVDEAGV